MKLVFLAAAAATVIACSDVGTATAPLQAPGSPLGAVVVNETTPVTQFVTNPCNGESAVLTGTLHLMVSTNESNNTGSFMMKQQLSGVGASGIQYKATYSNTDRYKLDPNSTTQIYSSASATVIATGRSATVSTQDWHETQTFRVIFPAGGATPSVERTSVSQECRGKPAIP